MSTRSTNPKDMISDTKAPLQLVPTSMVIYAAMQMKNGAGKYGAHNYRATGVRASVYYAGLMRHLIDWYNGNDLDEDGILNMAGMAANLSILADAYAHGYLVDDRPPRVNMRKLITAAEREAKVSNERHAGKNPRHYTIADPTYFAINPPSFADVSGPQTTRMAACFDDDFPIRHPHPQREQSLGDAELAERLECDEEDRLAMKAAIARRQGGFTNPPILDPIIKAPVTFPSIDWVKYPVMTALEERKAKEEARKLPQMVDGPSFTRFNRSPTMADGS